MILLRDKDIYEKNIFESSITLGSEVDKKINVKY